jgi:hypothetical protein
MSRRGWQLAGVLGTFVWCLAAPSHADGNKLLYGTFRIRSDAKVTADVPTLWGGKKHKDDWYIEPGLLTLSPRTDTSLDLEITIRGYTCTVQATPAGASKATLVPKTCESGKYQAKLQTGSITWNGDEISMLTEWTSTLGSAMAAIRATSTGKLKANVPACYSTAQYDQCISRCAKNDNGCRDGCNGTKNSAVDRYCFDP